MEFRNFTGVKTLIVCCAAVLVAAMITVLYVFNPESVRFYPRCPFSLLGFSCAGCGTLRALHCYLHGDFARAFNFNPLFPFSLAFVCLLLVKPRIALNVWVLVCASVVVAGYSILRNVYGF